MNVADALLFEDTPFTADQVAHVLELAELHDMPASYARSGLTGMLLREPDPYWALCRWIEAFPTRKADNGHH